MMTVLKTEFVRIGRSGATVDSRTIPPEALKQAAESYNPALFTALIWLEHMRYSGHLGKVVELKTTDNEEGGVDLWATLSPNRNYLTENQIYQEGWFSSMELTPDFRKTGKWYLTGLGATNEPASVATSEIRFSKLAKETTGGFIAEYHQTEKCEFDTNQESPLFNLLKNFFSADKPTTPENQDMADNQELLRLKQQMKDLQDKVARFSTQKTDEEKPDTSALLALQQENAELKTQVEVLKVNNTKRAEEFNALQTQVKDLSDTLSAALKEQPSTQSYHNQGAAEDNKPVLA